MVNAGRWLGLQLGLWIVTTTRSFSTGLHGLPRGLADSGYLDFLLRVQAWMPSVMQKLQTFMTHTQRHTDSFLPHSVGHKWVRNLPRLKGRKIRLYFWIRQWVCSRNHGTGDRFTAIFRKHNLPYLPKIPQIGVNNPFCRWGSRCREYIICSESNS